MKLVTRAQWGARSPRSRPALPNPPGATAHWEGPRMGVFPHESCPAKCRGIQAFHMDARGWSDGAYNFFACPHGYVFEMRGVGVRSAANGTNTGNDLSGAVCYLGGEGDPFTPEGAAAMADALHLVSPGGKRHAHRDWKPTACPGDTITAWVRTAAARSAGAPAPRPLSGPEKLYWFLWAGKEALRKPFLQVGSESDPALVPHINSVRKAFGMAETGIYGPAVHAKVKAFQAFLGIPTRGLAGRMNRRTWQWLIYDVFTRGRR